MSVKIVSTGGIGMEVLKARIIELDKLSVFVGWLESAMYDDNTPVAGIAAVHEYGSTRRGIPPRPFLRTTEDEKKGSWKKFIESGARRILKGESTANEVMELLGLKIVGQIKVAIKNVNAPELSPITIALRKIRADGDKKIGGALVGSVAKAIAEGKTGAGELGDQTFANKKPLNETGYMIATITHEVR